METKWTKGPWIWVEQYRGGHAWLQSTSEKFTIGNAIIDDGSARGEYAPRITVDEANAHLIAAAPDLYESLEYLAKEVENDGVCLGILNRCWDALAKARGEQ